MIYGYARVSTDGQSVSAQVAQLRAAGAETVFREVASGAKTDRRPTLGRKPKLTPHQMKEAAKRRDHGKPVREIARSYNVSHSTILRLAAT
jgi:DNA invertase Pin-like site-specific DNA recombinase